MEFELKDVFSNRGSMLWLKIACGDRNQLVVVESKYHHRICAVTVKDAAADFSTPELTKYPSALPILGPTNQRL